MTDNQFKDFVSAQDWKDEKVLPQQYILKNSVDKAGFLSAIKFIRVSGTRRDVGGSQVPYYRLGDYEYWASTKPIDLVFVLCRKKLEQAPGKEVMTETELNEFIESSQWIFAKTMANIPHEYILRERSSDANVFDKFVIHVRENINEKQPFYGKMYDYFVHNGYKYWHYANEGRTAILVNRAKV